MSNDIDTIVGGKAWDKNAFWKNVDDIMKVLYKKHPREMRDMEIYARQKRDSALNKFGSNKDKTFRQLCGIPYRLDMALKVLYAEGNGGMPVTGREFQRGFARRYPNLRFCEVI